MKFNLLQIKCSLKFLSSVVVYLSVNSVAFSQTENSAHTDRKNVQYGNLGLPLTH